MIEIISRNAVCLQTGKSGRNVRHMRLSHPPHMHLKETHGQSWRYILYRGLGIYLGMLLVALLFAAYRFYTPVPSVDDSAMVRVSDTIFRAFFFACLIVTLVRLAYDALYHALYDYSIELEHLTISKGVFSWLRASFPIARISDVSIKRNFLQILCGVADVDILTSSPDTESGLIEGLSFKTALELQAELLALIENTLPEAEDRGPKKIRTKETGSVDVKKDSGHQEKSGNNNLALIIQ